MGKINVRGLELEYKYQIPISPLEFKTVLARLNRDRYSVITDEDNTTSYYYTINNNKIILSATHVDLKPTTFLLMNDADEEDLGDKMLAIVKPKDWKELQILIESIT